MPREKWLIDPGELDEYQREIRELGLNESYLVKGCAGSGKTILALYRANDLRIQAKAENKSSSFTVVVYTKALKSFIRSGIMELGIEIRQVVHYTQWDGSAVDHIIVDEVQDFDKEQMEVFVGATNKSMMLYGDSQQQVYKNRLNTDEIAAQFGLPQKELRSNYRLPKLVASFASHLCEDKELQNRCIKEGDQKPRIIRFNSWQQELDYIMTEIRTRNYTDVAILLPFNTKKKAPTRNFHRNVETVKEYLDNKSFSHEYKLRDDDNHDNIDLDFDSELPKVLSLHSAKGLQFETVFIPFCDYPRHDDWFISHYQKPIYVGLTRTYRNLYLTHTNDINPFFKRIPPFKYD
jgi:superfamily I DNA/RNA helicase